MDANKNSQIRLKMLNIWNPWKESSLFLYTPVKCLSTDASAGVAISESWNKWDERNKDFVDLLIFHPDICHCKQKILSF